MAGKKRSLWNFAERFEGDKVVWIIVLMLLLLSIVCIFSSTSRLLSGGQTRLDIVRGQLMIVALGLGLIILCYNIKSVGFLRWCSKWGFLLSLVLLGILDLRIDAGFVKAVNINSAWRILQVGPVQVHVFEVVKVAMVMYLSWALDALKKGELKGSMSRQWKKYLYIYAPFLVTFVMIIPGSNSSALFIGGIMLITILLGGGGAKDMGILILGGVLIVAGIYATYSISDGKAFQRIGTGISRVFDDTDWEKIYLDPSSTQEQKQAALDKMRQPYSAKIAIKEGGLLGKGPGQSTQRYVVPDISEDYMYSFIIEEYGLLGGILVIFLYVSLLARASIIVRNCGSDLFSKLAVAGLSLLITGQAFLHMFVNADIGPMTGQTLPLISHGNSAFLCFSLAFGIILSLSRCAARRIDRETRAADPLVQMHEAAAPAPDSDPEADLPEEMDELKGLEDLQDYGI